MSLVSGLLQEKAMGMGRKIVSLKGSKFHQDTNRHPQETVVPVGVKTMKNHQTPNFPEKKEQSKPEV